MNYQYKGGFTAGLFVDIPLFPSSFSIYTGANLSKHGFSYFKNIEGYDVDFVLNITSLKVPIMLKYTLPWVEYRPYVGAGLTGTYHLRNKGEIFEMRNTGNVINIDDSYDVSAIDNFQLGLVAETGVEKKLTSRNYLSLGLKYSFVPGNSESLGSSEICVITRINF